MVFYGKITIVISYDMLKLLILLTILLGNPYFFLCLIVLLKLLDLKLIVMKIIISTLLLFL